MTTPTPHPAMLGHVTERELEERVRELHEAAAEGESPETPFIVTAGVWLFLVPFFLLMLGAALTAYYLG